MYPSTFVLKRLVLVRILAVVAIQLFLIRRVSSLNMTNAYLNHKCMVTQGKYKPGSAYEKTLKSIINSIASTSNNIAGYDMASFEGPNNTVSAILQCRGDSYGPKCRDCFDYIIGPPLLSALRKYQVSEKEIKTIFRILTFFIGPPLPSP
ncbi:putative cysteine-rich repeat secretory protein 17 [Eutrema salsugineum]|uniref:putative cysteine-rich repeat secretory protein 17 n=1 Tax=Eutrema salsugineum TaxID=72664 RepID=UPI000CED278D|nr:putative cysteine-rich repeat secretory protein 17 [Eutrema salsugineum]